MAIGKLRAKFKQRANMIVADSMAGNIKSDNKNNR